MHSIDPISTNQQYDNVNKDNNTRARLTAAVAFRAAGTTAGRGADMLLPHMQSRSCCHVTLSFRERRAAEVTAE